MADVDVFCYLQTQLVRQTSMTVDEHSLGDQLSIVLPEHIDEQQRICLEYFEGWSESEQVHFVERLLHRMCHHQHGDVELFLRPMLQRDFISALPGVFCSLLLKHMQLETCYYSNVAVESAKQWECNPL